MKLQRHRLEKYNPCKRDIKDSRKKIAWAVFSYLDENGVEYRRSYTAPCNTPENYFWGKAPKQITTLKNYSYGNRSLCTNSEFQVFFPDK